MKTLEYRLYPNKAQRRLLMACLAESRVVYNEMLAASKEHYEQTGKFLLKYDLTAHFKGRGGKHIPASTIQCLADRLDKTFKRFFALKKRGEKGGFPRFKPLNRWHSIPLRQLKNDFSFAEDGKHLSVPKKLGGSLKMKLHRPLEGIPKTCHLVLRADGHWYALIVCETDPHHEHPSVICAHPDIGIDVGLTSFLTDSEGKTVENPRYYRRSQKTLRRKQRQLCRRKKGSKRRRKAARSTAQSHLKIKRQRRDFHFKVANSYAKQYHRIAVEHLNIKGMVKNHHLAQSIMDASWGAFLDILEAKAANAGHHVIRVNPRFTTQACSKCGTLIQKSLSVRTHICTSCGYVANRDVNAAQNILSRAGAPPSGMVSVGSPIELRSPQL